MSPDSRADSAATDPEPVPAGFLRRFGAMVYDGLLVVSLWMITLFILVGFSNTVVSGPTVQSLLFVELFAFFAYFWVFRGQTLGMLAWSLTISSTRGPAVSPTQALLRFIAALVSFACLGLGYVWILFDPMKRGWPDLFSDSVILHTPKAPPQSG